MASDGIQDLKKLREATIQKTLKVAQEMSGQFGNGKYNSVFNMVSNH